MIMVSKARNVARKDIMMAPCRGYLIVARCQNRHRYNYHHFTPLSDIIFAVIICKIKIITMIVCLFDTIFIIISY